MGALGLDRTGKIKALQGTGSEGLFSCSENRAVRKSADKEHAQHSETEATQQKWGGGSNFFKIFFFF